MYAELHYNNLQEQGHRLKLLYPVELAVMEISEFKCMPHWFDGVLPLQTPWNADCDVWWDEVMETASDECEPEWLDAEDPLFILYTSGSTGKPKASPTLALSLRLQTHCTHNNRSNSRDVGCEVSSYRPSVRGSKLHIPLGNSYFYGPVGQSYSDL